MLNNQNNTENQTEAGDAARLVECGTCNPHKPAQWHTHSEARQEFNVIPSCAVSMVSHSPVSHQTTTERKKKKKKKFRLEMPGGSILV